MNIVTVLRSGGIYTPEWVQKLARQLPGHDVYCMTDMDVEGVTCIPLATDLPGWWAKLELFRPDTLSEYGHRWLYVDLDSVIVGKITEDMVPDHWFWMLRDFYRKWGGQSAVMAFSADSPETLNAWARFKAEDHMYRFRGDQDYLEWATGDKFHRLQDHAAGVYLSFKADKVATRPEHPCIISMHGDPKPSDPAAGWAHKHWKES